MVISIGEGVDKLSILDLKKKYIKDPLKLKEINNEIDILKEYKKYIDNEPIYYKLLIYSNEKIWNLTNQIKILNIENENYSNICYDIFEFNQKRFRIKNIFNILYDSKIKECKSYKEKCCNIIVNNIDTLYNKLNELCFLILDYDKIKLVSSFDTSSVIKIPDWTFQDEYDTIVLDEFNLGKDSDKFL